MKSPQHRKDRMVISREKGDINQYHSQMTIDTLNQEIIKLRIENANNKYKGQYEAWLNVYPFEYELIKLYNVYYRFV